MTSIRMRWSRLEMKIDGHADWGPKGADLVCCAVSTLIQTLVACLEEGEKRGRLSAEIKAADGMYKEIRANPNMGTLGETKAYFRSCMTGLKMLARDYPKNVSVMEVE